MEWTVYHIRDVKNIVICDFKSHPKTIRAYNETRTLLDWVEFLNDLNYKEKAENIDVIDLPPSKQVTIRTGDDNELYFIFKSTSNKLMFELSEFYRVGNNPGPSEERFKKLYLAYEELEEDPDLVLKSIRHSLSHSRKSLNNKNTIEALTRLFGDKKINLKNRKHNKVFKAEYERLKKFTTDLFIKKIKENIISQNKFEIYYIS